MVCTSKHHGVIACPRHDNLDLDLYNVRVVNVVCTGTDLLVDFVASDGRWVGSNSGRWVDVSDVEVSVTCGTETGRVQDGDEERWSALAGLMTEWQKDGTYLRMVAAPDRLSLLWDPATGTPIPLPRSAPEDPR